MNWMVEKKEKKREKVLDAQDLKLETQEPEEKLVAEV